jgi:hypothetical protein
VKSFLRRKFKMSKKLLNEAAVRRFMGLAGMQANMVSNTVTEMYNKDEGEHEEKKEMDHPMEEAAHEEKDEGYMMKEEDEDMAPVEDEMAMDAVEDEMMGEPEMDAAPEMEITSEEAEVLANVLQKLMAARDGMADEPEMDMDAEEEVEMADDEEVEAEEDEEDAEAMMETTEEMNEDEIVQEVARRVAARILKAKKAQKEMNEALGK